MLLPRLAARLAAEAPYVDLIVRPADLHVVLGQLEAGEADLALTATPPHLGAHLRHEVVYTDGFAVRCDPGRLGLTAPPPSLEAYLAIPHALVSPAGLQHGVIDDALAREGSSRRRVSVSVARFSTLPFLLKGARLLTNMPAVSAVHYARAFDLACLKLPIASPTFGVALVWYARDAADPARLGQRRRPRGSAADQGRGAPDPGGYGLRG